LAAILANVLTNEAQNPFFKGCEHLDFLQSFSIVEFREVLEKIQEAVEPPIMKTEIDGEDRMEAQNAQTIVNEIGAHIQKQGGALSAWYAGITENVDERLFGAHNVPKKDHWYAYRRAVSASAARSAEKALLDWGCEGGTGGGHDDTVYVYAYLKAAATNP
jgi:hypothetical protein